ncbi:hypothetical protein [Asaccharospora irregularis]|uniref:Uncharacterized protein n=1 Tax=Asaccharospora irregularis DSM 2635 TaxID=1121321 RepID=A0A1M5KWD8_9FIRM|nr:hypothetical protein [Asaccharospora irregularis]SHG57124.1 hypothetical protein SAMN04488530_103144 [Asaccharospora irregularis DSM 2635]
MNNPFKKSESLGSKKSKKIISYGVIFITALFLGSGIGSSEMVPKDDYERLKAENKNLQAKVEEAKTFFEMKDAEKEALKIETLKKEEENKREQDKLAEEKRKEDELKKQKELEARTVTLGNGTYLVGKDIPEGVYDIYAVKGGGNVMSSSGINLIMGVEGEENFYQREEQNAALKDGDTIELSSVTVKFVPDDGYEVK